MKLFAIVIATLCLATGCSGNSDPKSLIDEGSKAINSGKYEDAAASYEKALAKIGDDTANPDWKRAKLGLVQAQAGFDPTRAKDGFLELARSNPGVVTDEDFNKVASRLGDAGKFPEAIAILEAGKKTYPDSKHLDALGQDLAKRAKDSGANDALDKLKGLGYGGD